MSEQAQEILLANPRGFCAGVERAIAIVEEALKHYGAPIYVRHEVVHNKFVVDELREKGAIFVEQLDEIPDDQIVIFSAHGVPKSVREAAAARKLTVYDATCPLVTKVHLEVRRLREKDFGIIMIGHKGHPEVEGTMGQVGDGVYLVENVSDALSLQVKTPEKLAYVTQTTLSVDDTKLIIETLQQRFPEIVGPKKDDICYATQNRQDVVKLMVPQIDLLIVVGSINSSNSNRLTEVAKTRGVDAYLVNNRNDLQAAWLDGKKRIGVTAGASAPEVIVQDVITGLRALGAKLVRNIQATPENVSFPLPRELLAAIKQHNTSE